MKVKESLDMKDNEAYWKLFIIWVLSIIVTLISGIIIGILI